MGLASLILQEVGGRFQDAANSVSTDMNENSKVFGDTTDGRTDHSPSRQILGGGGNMSNIMNTVKTFRGNK